MNQRTDSLLLYHGLGFPVLLEGVPVRVIRGEAVPDVDFARLEDDMAIMVALKPARLTGAEVRFLRLHLGLGPAEFAALFDVTRRAATKWEAHGEAAGGMTWSAEKDLRLHVLDRKKIPATEFRRAFERLTHPPLDARGAERCGADRTDGALRFTPRVAADRKSLLKGCLAAL